MEFEDHFCIMIGFCCKNRLDSELVGRLDHTANVVTDQLRQNFVFHGDIGLTPHAVPKLSLDHRERAFDIGPLVVVAQELIFLQAERMIHLCPQSALAFRCIDSERDVGRGSNCLQGVVVLVTPVCLVCGRLFDLESYGCRLDQRWEHGAIVGVLMCNLNGRNAIRQHAGHDVDLHPRMFLVHSAVLGVVPSVKLTSGKTGGIRRELRFQALQRQGGLHDKRVQKWIGFFIFQKSGDGAMGDRFTDMALVYSIPQIRHEPSPRETAVNLVTCSEHLIRERGWWTTAPARPFRFLDHTAQIKEQLKEFGFLVDLRGFVGRPDLPIGLAWELDRLAIWDALSRRVPFPAVCVILALDPQDGANVLASVLMEFKRRTGARMAVVRARLRVHAVQDDFVLVGQCEGKDTPCPIGVCDTTTTVCEFAGLFLRDVHVGTLPLGRRGGRMAIEGAFGVTAPVHLASGVAVNSAGGFLVLCCNYIHEIDVSKL